MSLSNKTDPPEMSLSFSFPCVCLQGEVVEFIDEFLDEDKYPMLEGPPKH